MAMRRFDFHIQDDLLASIKKEADDQDESIAQRIRLILSNHLNHLNHLNHEE